MRPATALATLATLFTLAAAPAAALEPGPAPGPTFDWSVRALGGGFDGQGTRTDSGGLLSLALAGEAAWRLGGLQLAVPARLRHVQTVGATLSETSGALSVEPTWRLESGTRLGLEAGLQGAWRPDWPDQYQRSAAGVLPPTDRYSFLALRLGAHGWWQPAARQHLRLRYRFVARRFKEDPAFDPTVPTHLTPSDVDVHEVSGSWRRVGPSTALGVRLDVTSTRYLVLPARDATTAATSGNPRQRLRDVEPGVEVELWRDGPLELQLRYALLLRTDTWQGYYSYTGHRPQVSVTWRAAPRLVVEAGVEGWLLQYGPSAKSGSSTTPTQDGKDRWDRKAAVSGSIRYTLRPGLSLVGEAEWITRTTNYPDYVPGVFPASRSYDIAFDYDNARALLGVEWKG
jgi:hypothetical protein